MECNALAGTYQQWTKEGQLTEGSNDELHKQMKSIEA